MKIFAITLACISATIPTFANVVKITYPDWPEGVLLTHMAASVLEDKMGYEVKLTLADPEVIYDSVATGTQDVYLDAWLPFTHSLYWEKHAFNLERLGTVIQRARIGLAVPTYVEVDSINDLNEHRAALDGKIIGIEEDAGITTMTNRAIDEYKLEFKQINSGSAAMTTALERAIAAKKPIVMTGWTPHWMFARYELKMLQDSKNVYQPDGIRKFARLGFSEDFPDANRFLKRFALTEEQLNALLLEIHDAKQSQDVIIDNWLSANADIVEAWIAPEKKWWQKIF
jgi:glycine betaine/proline transport system substrate-binding protein